MFLVLLSSNKLASSDLNVLDKSAAINSEMWKTVLEEFSCKSIDISNALKDLKGTFVVLNNGDWSFRHPSLLDGLVQIATKMHLHDIYIPFAKPQVLLSQVVCGEVDVKGEPVRIPTSEPYMKMLLDRLVEPPAIFDGYYYWFFVDRCDTASLCFFMANPVFRTKLVEEVVRDDMNTMVRPNWPQIIEMLGFDGVQLFSDAERYKMRKVATHFLTLDNGCDLEQYEVLFIMVSSSFHAVRELFTQQELDIINNYCFTSINGSRQLLSQRQGYERLTLKHVSLFHNYFVARPPLITIEQLQLELQTLFDPNNVEYEWRDDE